MVLKEYSCDWIVGRGDCADSLKKNSSEDLGHICDMILVLQQLHGNDTSLEYRFFRIACFSHLRIIAAIFVSLTQLKA